MERCLEEFVSDEELEAVRAELRGRQWSVAVEGGEQEREGLQRRKRVTRLQCEGVRTRLHRLQRNRRVRIPL